MGFRDFKHRLHITNVTEGDDSVQIVSGERKNDRVGTCGKQKPVIVFRSAVFRNHRTVASVNLDYRFTRMEFDAIFFIPLLLIEHDAVDLLFSR